MNSESFFSMLFGYGLKNGFDKYNRQLQEIEYFPKEMKPKFNSTHNDFIDLYMMFGLIGLIAFLWLMYSLAVHAFKKKNLIGLSFFLMAGVQFFFGSYFFWFRSGKFSFFFISAILLLLNDNFLDQKENG